jgi:hypothetical protein
MNSPRYLTSTARSKQGLFNCKAKLQRKDQRRLIALRIHTKYKIFIPNQSVEWCNHACAGSKRCFNWSNDLQDYRARHQTLCKTQHTRICKSAHFLHFLVTRITAQNSWESSLPNTTKQFAWKFLVVDSSVSIRTRRQCEVIGFISFCRLETGSAAQPTSFRGCFPVIHNFREINLHPVAELNCVELYLQSPHTSPIIMNHMDISNANISGANRWEWRRDMAAVTLSPDVRRRHGGAAGVLSFTLRPSFLRAGAYDMHGHEAEWGLRPLYTLWRT